MSKARRGAVVLDRGSAWCVALAGTLFMLLLAGGSAHAGDSTVGLSAAVPPDPLTVVQQQLKMGGLPVSYLRNIIIDKAEIALPALPLPPGVGPVNIARLKSRHVIPTMDYRPLTQVFDPAIYAVYGIMVSDNGAQAIIGLAGGDTQVLQIGEYVGDTDAKVMEIDGDSVFVRSDSAMRMDRIGFYGGDPAPLFPPLPSAASVRTTALAGR